MALSKESLKALAIQLAAAMPPPITDGSRTCVVYFGTRRLEFLIGANEIENLRGHALQLTQTSAALQHLVGLYLPADGDLNYSEPFAIQAGLTFIAGMAAELLAAAEGSPP